MTSASEDSTDESERCSCCGGEYSADQLIRLDEKPEVAVCLRCAEYLSRRARVRRAELSPSIIGRIRRSLWSTRRYVVDHGLQNKPIIGPVLRWLGRVLP